VNDVLVGSLKAFRQLFNFGMAAVNSAQQFFDSQVG
jgi:hypothetical protein